MSPDVLLAGTGTGMLTLWTVMTVVVLIAVAVAILVFERPRARRIQRDLRDAAREQREHDDRDPH